MPSARPTDSLRVIPAAEFVGMGRRLLGIEEHVAVRCPCCDAVEMATRHPARTHMSQIRGAPTISPCNLSYVPAARNFTPSGERRTVHCGREPADGHRHQERKSSRGSEQGV